MTTDRRCHYTDTLALTRPVEGLKEYEPHTVYRNRLGGGSEIAGWRIWRRFMLGNRLVEAPVTVLIETWEETERVLGSFTSARKEASS